MTIRYISENLTGYINQGEWDAGNTNVDYTKMSDDEAEVAREDLIEEKGFFILPSELFCNVRKRAPQDENLNMTLETVFNHIEDSAKGSVSENSFAGLFDALFNRGQNHHRVFCPGIVGRQDAVIRQAAAYFTHHGPLSLVAVAAASEHRDYAVPCKLADGFQNVLNRVR